MLIAAVAFPDLKACKGIEYLEGLSKLAEEICKKFKEECDESGVKCASIEAVQGDILQDDWSDGDIIFANSPLFTPDLLAGMTDKFKHLKKGSRIISLQDLPQRDYLQQYASIRIMFSWGMHFTNYYNVI